jgi:hypothetical protein
MTTHTDVDALALASDACAAPLAAALAHYPVRTSHWQSRRLTLTLARVASAPQQPTATGTPGCSLARVACVWWRLHLCGLQPELLCR